MLGSDKCYEENKREWWERLLLRVPLYQVVREGLYEEMTFIDHKMFVGRAFKE